MLNAPCPLCPSPHPLLLSSPRLLPILTSPHHSLPTLLSMTVIHPSFCNSVHPFVPSPTLITTFFSSFTPLSALRTFNLLFQLFPVSSSNFRSFVFFPSFHFWSILWLLHSYAPPFHSHLSFVFFYLFIHIRSTRSWIWKLVTTINCCCWVRVSKWKRYY